MTHSKCTWVAVLTIASIGVLVAEAQAQRRTLFGRGRGGSPTDLLRREDVREELGISEDQQKQLEELGQSQGAAFRELLPRLREAGSDEARQQIMREYRDGINAKVKAIVDENQYNRLQQLNYQRLGPRALTGDELAAELKLSDEQKDNIRATIDKFEEQRSSVRFNRDLSDEERDAKLSAISDEREKAVSAILSAQQRQQFEGKKGTAFEFTADGSRGNPTPAPAPAAVARGPLPASVGPTVLNADGTPVTEDVVVSFGVEDRTAGEPVKEVQFNFQGAQWIDVLKLLAKMSGLALDADRTPPGSFTYFDDKKYTPDQARDIINGYLLKKGWILVKRDRFLVVLNLDEPIPPNVIEPVEISELANRGNNELMTVVIPLDGITADDAAAEAENLIGPQGSVAPLSLTNKLVVTDIGSNLRRIVALLTEVPDSNKAFSKFPLKHIAAADAEDIIRDLFGLERRGAGNVSAGAAGSSRGGDSRFSSRFAQSRFPQPNNATSAAAADPNAKVQITIDERTNTLLVKAGPDDLKVVKEAIDSIDVEPPEGFIPRNNTPYLEVYQLKSADAIEVTKTLNVLYPGTVINEDGRTRRIHIRATADEHKEIGATIRRLDGEGPGGMQVAVVPLGRMDAYTATASIQSLFLADGTDAPTVQPHPTGNALLIRGTQGQVEQITNLLAQLDPSEGANSDSTMRTIPLGGRDGKEFMRVIERVWNQRNQRNPIRTVVPSAGGPVRDRRIPALNPRGGVQDSVPVESAPADTGGESGGEARTTPRVQPSPVSRPAFPPVQRRTKEVPGNVSAGVSRRTQPVLVSLVQQATGTETGSNESVPLDESQTESAGEAAGSNDAAQETGSEAAPGSPAEGNEEKPPSNAPVFLTVERGNLLAYSDDPAVLNRLEDLIASLSAAMPPTTQWTVFYLQSADATETSSILERIFPTSSVSTISSANDGLLSELTGGISSMGRGLVNMAGLEGITTGPQTLRIIPDVRSNSLFVSGPPYLVDEVEDVLQVLDASELPEQLRERAPRYIAVKHADVADVADIVNDVYKEEMTPPQQRQNQRGQNPLAAMMGGGGGSNGNSRAQRVKLTVGVDYRTSRLIVSCSEPLFLQIEEMVKDIDEAARAAKRTTRVVTLNNVNSSVIKQTLGQLMPRVRVSSSSTRGGSDGGQSRGSQGASQGQPSGDQIRQMMMQRAGQGGGSPFGGGRFQGGGNRGGSPFGGGASRSPFGGGRGGSPFGGGSSRGGSPFGGRSRGR